jgi:hypothetical protein
MCVLERHITWLDYGNKYGVHNYIVIYFRRNYQNGKQMGVYV